MKNNKMKDERIAAASNRIYKICFYILCAAIFLDLIIKFNLWSFSGRMFVWGRGENDFPFIITIGLESLFLLGAFFINVFMLAKKGISFGSSDLDTECFPKKRYALISLCIAGGVAVSSIIIRIIVYFADGNFATSPNRPLDFLVFSFFVLFIFLIIFVLFFSIFYLAFRISKKSLKNYPDQDVI